MFNKKRDSACFVCFLLFVWSEFFVPLENFSLIWRCHHYWWTAANFDLCWALMAIEQWGFFSVPHLLWHGASVYNGHLQGPVTLSLSGSGANALTHCATAAARQCLEQTTLYDLMYLVHEIAHLIIIFKRYIIRKHEGQTLWSKKKITVLRTCLIIHDVYICVSNSVVKYKWR